MRVLKTWARRMLGLAAAAGVALAPAMAAHAQPVDTGHIIAELAPQTVTVPPGGTVYVALSQKLDKGWHTYWRNPGDAGDPPQIRWTLPPGWTAGDIVWAKPQRLPLKSLMDYGYTVQALLPVPITAPASAKPGQTVTLKAAVSFLVCEALCIPEDAVLTATLRVADGAPAPHPTWGAAVDKALADAPKPGGLKGVMARQGDVVKLAVTGAALKGQSFPSAYFYPYASTVIQHAKPQKIEHGPDGLTFTLAAGYDFTQGKPPAQIAGVVEVGGKGYEVTARPGSLPPGAAGLGAVMAGGDDHAEGGGLGVGGGLSLPLALAFALMGGVILNLMPCVFPVLSMKAAALAGHAHEPRAARLHGLAFLAGVLATFLALAGALLAAKAAGAAVGWGFQLQSPAVVGALSLLMLLVALNLSGVFEVGAGLQGAAGGFASPGGLVGSALTGALAVVVAAPCTAPFMAGALGYALTQPPLLSLSVFAALGLGFALPFVLLTAAPGLLRRLPRPGPWMDVLRRVLAFPMYGAAAWLAWVFAAQAGEDALALLLAAAVVAALAAWLYGAFQNARLAGGRSLAFGVPAALAGAAAAALLVAGARSPAPVAAAQGVTVAGAVSSEPFSPERLAALRGEGRPVLVNFTADWCVTCKVNERVALSGAGLADALKRTGAVYLKGDWTSRDAVIARTLAEHGRAGVPLYLVYAAKGGDPVILPQLLTEGEVVSAVEAAAAS